MAVQARERISPLRAPVLSAINTTAYRSRLRLFLQASSKRTRSSSERNRTRPGGSLGLLTCSTGLLSVHCHSRRATEKAWFKMARYRLTVAGECPSASSSRYCATTAGVTSRSLKCPILSCHHSICFRWVVTVDGRLCGNTERRYRANRSPAVKRLAVVFAKCRPSCRPVSIWATHLRASVKRRKVAVCCGHPLRRTCAWYTFSPLRLVRSRIVPMPETIPDVPGVCQTLNHCPRQIVQLLYFQVPPRGLEPLTLGLEVRCSIQLS